MALTNTLPRLNLPDGASVVVVAPDARHVLCRWDRWDRVEYVVWGINEEGDVFDGSYFVVRVGDEMIDVFKQALKSMHGRNPSCGRL